MLSFICSVHFIDVTFGPQKLSERRLERLQELMKNHTMTIGDIESFKTDCDGKQVTLQDDGKSFLLCVVPSQEGDKYVAKDTPRPTDPPLSTMKSTPEPPLSKAEKDAIKDVLKQVSSGAGLHDAHIMTGAALVVVLSMLTAV
ncbi:hypothetical protein PINS_up019865 [Pythium insidiosum]|nr:hypothetical protein PINS_up007013 [Pythium insidiosum]GLD98319.1 hypothetical protein PINS_up007016 [Pythium insidiosum]GLE08580.1 hypothetical protein PINS_up019865 [Pythium insidiosum]